MKNLKLNIKRFGVSIEEDEPVYSYSENAEMKINADLKIEGTNRKLKDIDTAINNIDDRLNEQIYCSVCMQDKTQSFSSSTYSLINLGTIESDTHNGFNSQTRAYTVPKSGYYNIHTQIEFTVDSNVRRAVSRIHINGTIVRHGINAIIGGSGAVICDEIRYLNEGDVITLQGKVDGMNASIPAGNICTYMQIKKI